jgi:hypothetical protein
MKLNLVQPIIDLEGKPINKLDETGKVIGNFTFKDMIGVVLNTNDPRHPLTAEKKLFGFQIGIKIFGKELEEYELTIDQIKFLKEQVGDIYGSVVYGRFVELIGDLKSEE